MGQPLRGLHAQELALLWHRHHLPPGRLLDNSTADRQTQVGPQALIKSSLSLSASSRDPLCSLSERRSGAI